MYRVGTLILRSRLWFLLSQPPHESLAFIPRELFTWKQARRITSLRHIPAPTREVPHTPYPIHRSEHMFIPEPRHHKDSLHFHTQDPPDRPETKGGFSIPRRRIDPDSVLHSSAGCMFIYSIYRCTPGVPPVCRVWGAGTRMLGAVCILHKQHKHKMPGNGCINFAR